MNEAGTEYDDDDGDGGGSDDDKNKNGITHTANEKNNVRNDELDAFALHTQTQKDCRFSFKHMEAHGMTNEGGAKVRSAAANAPLGRRK